MKELNGTYARGWHRSPMVSYTEPFASSSLPCLIFTSRTSGESSDQWGLARDRHKNTDKNCALILNNSMTWRKYNGNCDRHNNCNSYRGWDGASCWLPSMTYWCTANYGDRIFSYENERKPLILAHHNNDFVYWRSSRECFYSIIYL